MFCRWPRGLAPMTDPSWRALPMAMVMGFFDGWRETKRSDRVEVANCREITARRAGLPVTGPLSGIRVVEFSHMVMGPSCGLVLGDLGADVVKIEPAPARRQYPPPRGSGCRLLRDVQPQQEKPRARPQAPKGLAFAKKLIAHADVLDRKFPSRRPRGARSRLRGAQRGSSRPHLLLSSRAFSPDPMRTAQRSTRWCR